MFRALEDVFAVIARVLDCPAITRARPEGQRTLAEQALRQQRTLLLLDNLGTVDDEELLDFLHELPKPTKALITTRHRIEDASPSFNVERAWGVVGNLAYALSQLNDTTEVVRRFQQSLEFSGSSAGAAMLRHCWCAWPSWRRAAACRPRRWRMPKRRWI